MIENGDMEGDDGKEFVEELQASCSAVSHVTTAHRVFPAGFLFRPSLVTLSRFLFDLDYTCLFSRLVPDTADGALFLGLFLSLKSSLWSRPV